MIQIQFIIFPPFYLRNTTGKSLFHLNKILGELLFIVNRFRKNDKHIPEKEEECLKSRKKSTSTSIY
jgi:hypothetical protein